MQHDEAKRSTFAKNVVAAIRSLEARKPPSQNELAATAFNALLYDFPLVNDQQLSALACSLRASLEEAAKAAPFPHHLSSKLVENVIAGAARSTKQPHAAQQQQQQPHEPDAEQTGPHSSGDPEPAAPDGSSAGEGPSLLVVPHAAALQAAYQQLSVVVLVDFVRAVLMAPESEAARMLAAINPSIPDGDGDSEDYPCSSGAAQEAAATAAAAAAAMFGEANQQGVEAAAAAFVRQLGVSLPAVPAVLVPAAASVTIYEEEHAACEDDDDFVFEPLEEPSSTSHGQLNSSSAMPGSSSHPAAGLLHPLQPHTAVQMDWPAIRDRLVQLSSHVHYSLMSCDQVWKEGDALPAVLQLLRAAGVHQHSGELAPLVYAYVSLLCDRLAACPADLDSLEQVLDAIGVKAVPHMPRTRRPARRAPGSGQVLPAEASLALTLLASLGTRAPSAAARHSVWQQVNATMLPVLERCLEELVACDADAEALAAVMLVAQVVVFYLEHRPANCDAAGVLLKAGVIRGLALLLPKYGPLPPAEALRTAVLLAAAGSAEVCNWVAAVPGVPAAFAAPAFQLGGCAEVHGAIFRHLGLIGSGSSSGKAGGSSSGGDGAMLVQLLQEGSRPDEIFRLHATLQLMARAAAAATTGRSSSLQWAPPVQAALRAALSALRDAGGEAAAASGSGSGGGAAAGADEQQPGSSSAGGAAPDAGSSSGQAPGGSGTDQLQSDDRDAAASGDADASGGMPGAMDPAVLAARRVQQLRPACIKLLKDLVMAASSGRGKMD